MARKKRVQPVNDLARELRGLRAHRGLTIDALTARPTLLTLLATASPSEALERIQLTLRDMGTAREAEALRVAYRLPSRFQPDAELLPRYLVTSGKAVAGRRSQFAAHQGISDDETVEEWENSAINALALRLADRPSNNDLPRVDKYVLRYDFDLTAKLDLFAYTEWLLWIDEPGQKYFHRRMLGQLAGTPEVGLPRAGSAFTVQFFPYRYGQECISLDIVIRVPAILGIDQAVGSRGRNLNRLNWGAQKRVLKEEIELQSDYLGYEGNLATEFEALFRDPEPEEFFRVVLDVEPPGAADVDIKYPNFWTDEEREEAKEAGLVRSIERDEDA